MHIECEGPGPIPGEAHQQSAAPLRKKQPQRGACRGQDQALGEQLPDEAAASCSKCQPDRHLFAARLGTGQQQVGQVGASDDEHQADRAHQNGQRLRICRSHRRLPARKWYRQHVVALA